MFRSLRAPVLLLAGLAVAPVSARAATFTVNSTANTADASVGNGLCATVDGQCTLRAAIQEANATPAVVDTIAFAIGTGPARISILTGLPAITAPVVVDGATQPGFSGTPLIEIEGSLFSGDGIRITGGDSTLRSLIVNRFGADGIQLTTKGGNVVEGCYIGTTADGLQAARNIGAGLRIESWSNRIGGTSIAQRNVISGNGGLGIEGGVMLVGETAVGNIVQGNFIGLDAAGLNPIGNLGRGVAIHSASYNLIGGAEPGAGNLIAGNRASGVRIMSGSTGNVVMKNWIGLNRNGVIQRGTYPEPGTLSNARGVQVRGDGNYVMENLIAGNTEDGVLFYDGFGRDLIPFGFPSNNVVQGNFIFQNGFSGIAAFVGERNRFVKNTIVSNGHLAINLEDHAFGFVTANDAGDLDEGTNGFQNFPVLTSAVAAGAQTTVTGTLSSRPLGTYAIEVFATPLCSAHGHGEAAFPLAQANVTTDATGAAGINVVLPYLVPKGWVMTATATDPLGSTSEVSACSVVR